MNLHRRLPPPALLLLSACGLLLLAALFAPLNQDEGWYLLAARRVSQGQHPYLDFTFTQPPLFPYLYQFATPLLERWGLLGARLLHVLLATAGFAGILHAVALPRPSTPHPRHAALATAAAFLLFALNPFHLQFSVTVKTYALAGLFVTAAACTWLRGPRLPHLAATALLLALATATRLTLGILFIPLGLSLLLRRRTLGDRPWLLFSAAGLASLALLFGPLLLRDPSATLFNLLTFHTSRHVDNPGLMRVGFFLRTLHAWFPAVLLMLGALLLPRPADPQSRAMTLGVMLVTLLHALAPFPYDEYQTVIFPWVVILLARGFALRIPPASSAKPLAALAALCTLFALSTPHNLHWLPARQDRIWWRTRPQSDLSLLRQTARDLRQILEPDALLFTPDAYLAIEGGFRVPQGLEMGPFSLSPSTSRTGLLDFEGIQNALDQSHAVAFTPYLFIASPEIRPLTPEEEARLRSMIEASFTRIRVIPDFGQQLTPLEIWIRRHE